jgi:PAS domain S-box-containing protein
LNDIVLFVNNTFLKTYGYSEHEILGKNINVVRSPNNPPEATRDILAATLAGGWSGELMNRTKDGRDFPVSLSTSFVRDEQGQDIALVGIATDITERKQEEEEISKSHEELRMLANHLQTIREEERNHLAREFHDQIGQSMTALKMDLSLLLRMISDEKQDMQRKLVIEELQSMQKLVDETSQLLWAIITELRPQMLDDLGLVATFEWEAQRFESRTGIPCEFKSFAGDIQIDSKKSIALFRIYQEALTNIARHANATVVKSVFQRVGEMLVLEIKDNGCGISIDEQFKQKPFGLIGMRERALAIGGLLEISGIAGEGTTIMVRLPIGQVATEESTRQ